ncbi:alkaline phosphatase D family protein [Sphingomonas sp. TDK1]|uniref:alkaline phosphatase D family protein n=1 Tax=Sphingomonas sp. TDK1 TaxID=453247 RepID=UPI0007D9A18A|nr:alkaline phosphatase D family protein [Sphingomonas sp. TDK1]OAN62735.1 alkaline phosphatase [Sphingomonas sp. TDK1]
MHTTRRELLLGAAGSLLVLGTPGILRAQQIFRAYPFTLGIAAGDASADGFVLWTRLAPEPLEPHGGMPMAPIAVEWEVGADPGFKTVAAKGEALARPELGHSVHVEVAGLQPDRPYWYRFICGRERSMRGRVKTLPAAGASVEKARFLVAGCQHYEQGLYTAYAHAAREEADFLFHYGDYIYEGRASPVAFDYGGNPRKFIRAHVGEEPFSLDDYRRRYAQYKTDPDLQAAHAATGWYATFDDHEIQNNWVGDRDQNGTPPEAFLLRRAAAFQAWYEHMPVRSTSIPKGDSIQAYRRARFGDLLDLHLLDTRQFRTDQPCDDGFKAKCAGWDAADAQVLGSTQEAWLGRNLAEGKARWNAVAQQVMMMPLDRRMGDEPAPIRNMDSWGGYDRPRERLFSKFAGHGNVVVLTGDEHQNYAGELRTRGGQGEAVAVEFVSTSISSGGDGADVRAGSDKILGHNPYLKYMNDRRGYLLCEVTRNEWQARFRTVDQVTDPGAPVKTARTAIVSHGRAQLDFA